MGPSALCPRCTRGTHLLLMPFESEKEYIDARAIGPSTLIDFYNPYGPVLCEAAFRKGDKTWGDGINPLTQHGDIPRMHVS